MDLSPLKWILVSVVPPYPILSSSSQFNPPAQVSHPSLSNYLLYPLFWGGTPLPTNPLLHT